MRTDIFILKQEILRFPFNWSAGKCLQTRKTPMNKNTWQVISVASNASKTQKPLILLPPAIHPPHRKSEPQIFRSGSAPSLFIGSIVTLKWSHKF